MTRDEAVTEIRAAANRDIPSGGSGADSPITDTILQSWLAQEYQATRRRLGELTPDLYQAVSASATVTGTTASFVMVGSGLSLTDFERLLKVERLDGGEWSALGVAPMLTAVSAGADGAGTYRVQYVTKPALSGNYTIDLPTGAERIPVENAAARVRARFEEDPAPHLRFAGEAWKEVAASLIDLYGAAPESVVEVPDYQRSLCFRLRGNTVELVRY